MEFERIVAVRNNKTVFRDGEDCIKLFKEDYPKDDILNEALNQARIERTSINVPKLKAITSFDGKWGIVSEFIEGKTIAELIKGHPGNSDEYIKVLVKVQRTVNAETCPMLNRQREKLVKKAILSGIEETKVKEILKSIINIPDCEYVCHGDLVPENVILKDGNISDGVYIVDWAHVTKGNPLFDAALSYIKIYYEYGKELAETYKKDYISDIAGDIAKELSADKTVEEAFCKFVPAAAAAIMPAANKKMREFLRSFVI